MSIPTILWVFRIWSVSFLLKIFVPIYGLNFVSLKQICTLTHTHTCLHTQVVLNTAALGSSVLRREDLALLRDDCEPTWKPSINKKTKQNKTKKKKPKKARAHTKTHAYFLLYQMELLMQFLIDLWCLFWNLSVEYIEGCWKQWWQSKGAQED